MFAAKRRPISLLQPLGDCLKCFLLLRSLWVFAQVAVFHLNDCIEYFTASCWSPLPLSPESSPFPVFAKRSLQQSHFRGRKHNGFLDSKKWSSPVQHVDICVILPAFCSFMVSGELLKQLGAFRASCRNPKNRIATRSNAWIWRARPFLVSLAVKIEIENSFGTALSKAKSGSAWQSHFWQCGILRPARNTKLFTLRK